MKPNLLTGFLIDMVKQLRLLLLKPVRRVVQASVATSLTNMLVSVVSLEGTARQAIIKGYDVAGKTGTSQKIVNGKYSRNHHVGSFVGFFPAEDPQISITVVVDEPKMKRGITWIWWCSCCTGI